jgi:hypothetical protein
MQDGKDTRPSFESMVSVTLSPIVFEARWGLLGLPRLE